MIKAIFAVDEHNAFGKDGNLPWNCPEDLAFFRKMTLGDVIVFGAGTYESVKYLDGRVKICITNQDPSLFPSALVFKSIDDVVKMYKSFWIIGGKTLLESTAHYADRILMTRILGKHDADTFLDVEKIVGNRQVIPDNTIRIGETAYVIEYGECVYGTGTGKTALEEALDREQKTTFGNIPIKETVEFVEDTAKGNALEITKQMIRGQS